MKNQIEKIYDAPTWFLNERQIRELERERELEPQRAARRAREALYLAALDAAERTGAIVTDEVRALQRHAVDLAAEANPPIVLRWLRPNSLSARLVKPAGAVALHGARNCAVPPITDAESYAVVAHEIGHLRAFPPGTGVLEREYRAWVWARKHSKIWNQRTQDVMSGSLRTYLTSAKIEDVIQVENVERLCSNFEFCREKQRRLMKDRS